MILTGCLPGAWMKDSAYIFKGVPLTNQPKPSFLCLPPVQWECRIENKNMVPVCPICLGMCYRWVFLYLLQTTILQTAIRSLTVTTVALPQSFFAATSIRVRSSPSGVKQRNDLEAKGSPNGAPRSHIRLKAAWQVKEITLWFKFLLRRKNSNGFTLFHL